MLLFLNNKLFHTLSFHYIMDLNLANLLLNFIAPSEITDIFLVSVSETPDYFFMEFKENSDLIPINLKGKGFKQNGFTNKIELHTFPQKGEHAFFI